MTTRMHKRDRGYKEKHAMRRVRDISACPFCGHELDRHDFDLSQFPGCADCPGQLCGLTDEN